MFLYIDNMVYTPYIYIYHEERRQRMPQFTVEFFEEINGEKPVEKFMMELDV